VILDHTSDDRVLRLWQILSDAVASEPALMEMIRPDLLQILDEIARSRAARGNGNCAPLSPCASMDL
jgi:hypothetical protein